MYEPCLGATTATEVGLTAKDCKQESRFLTLRNLFFWLKLDTKALAGFVFFTSSSSSFEEVTSKDSV